ncbi:MAG: hypothetical protein WC734_05615 [Patescibacteria group bacterium]|jgi:hypothetical protein
MGTSSRNDRIKAFILWYIGTGALVYIVEIAFLHERQWLGTDGNFSFLQLLLQILSRAVAWPMQVLFGINGLGFSAEGLYGSWYLIGITIVSLFIGWWIIHTKTKKPA